MIAAICVAFLVLDYNEERVWGYRIGSAHDLDKNSHSPWSRQVFYKPCEYYFFTTLGNNFATIKNTKRLQKITKYNGLCL